MWIRNPFQTDVNLTAIFALLVAFTIVTEEGNSGRTESRKFCPFWCHPSVSWPSWKNGYSAQYVEKNCLKKQGALDEGKIWNHK